MEYKQFDKIQEYKPNALKITIDLLKERPMLFIHLKDELRKYIGTNHVNKSLDNYISEGIIELKPKSGGLHTHVGLSKKYREKLKKQQ